MGLSALATLNVSTQPDSCMWACCMESCTQHKGSCAEGRACSACCLAPRLGSTEKCTSRSARSIMDSVYGRCVSGLMHLSASTPATSLNSVANSSSRSLSEICSRQRNGSGRNKEQEERSTWTLKISSRGPRASRKAVLSTQLRYAGAQACQAQITQGCVSY